QPGQARMTVHEPIPAAPARDTPSRIDELRRAEAALRESEERYRSFVANSAEGVWRIELRESLAIGVPEDEQIEHMYRYAFLAECNDAMARMYGFGGAEDLVGIRLEDLLVRSDPDNLEYLRAFIRSGYRLADAESHEMDRNGNAKIILNSLTGLVRDGLLLRAWGVQRDITDRKRIEAERLELLRREQAARQDAENANRLKDEFLATGFQAHVPKPIEPAALAALVAELAGSVPAP
ncbi:MAG: PAS domain-containing protein, partial [Gemmatimonadota bacterium]